MMQSMKNNQKGFTLVELMIVVAIIGILAAIAVPQFQAYRTRSINSSAKAIGHNAKGAQSDLNAELGCFGHSEAAAADLTAVTGAAAAADSGATIALAAPATNATGGGRLAGTNSVSTKDFAVPFGLGANMIADISESAPAVGTCPTGGCSYVILTRATRGDTAYGFDSDVESMLYSVSHPDWPTAGNGLQATVVAVTDATNDIDGQAGGGAPTTTWEESI